MRNSVLTLTGLAAAIASSAHAGATQVHAVTISGQARSVGGANCNTSGPTPGVAGFFNTGVPVPVGGHAGCSLAGEIKDIAGGDGPISANLALNNTFGGGVNTATADAVAALGALGVSATEAYSGTAADSSTYLYSEAAAYFADKLDYGGTGMGYVQWDFDIDGVMTMGGIGGEALTFLNYQVNSEPIYTAFLSKLSATSGEFARNPTGVGDLSGFTLTPTSVSGAAKVFTYIHYLDLSKPFDFKVGLYTAAYTRAGGSISNDFFHTAKLSGIRVYDERGNPLDVHFTGLSGTIYDANGVRSAVAGVPEPSTWALAILGFGLAGAGLRRRRLA